MISNARFKRFTTPEEAVLAVQGIYNANIKYLREQFEAFAEGQIPKQPVRACYPELRLTTTETGKKTDNRLSFGYVPLPGVYATTLTRPDIFEHYYKQQIRLLLENHEGKLEVGLSDTPIPIHFALGEDFHLEQDLDAAQIAALPRLFDQPNLDKLDDSIANSYYVVKEGEPHPLSLFPAARVDLSLLRLKHYTGTKAEHFQNYVIFTNYQFYIDEFIRIGHGIMAPTDDPHLKRERGAYTAFVEPGNKVTANRNIDNNPEINSGEAPSRMPQMPTYHLKRADGSGITMVNIGVGPSNAKTITDHIAVLRPHAWLMLGHCAGLRNSQRLGDYVLAHAYLRNDQVLDDDLHPSIPVPALAEIQQALETAVAQVTGYEGYDLKKIMRTGTVATIDDRNWELRTSVRQNRRLSQSRAIALDMESATIAANGFRFRVPYGTLLCVSDKPLHGQLKLPGMADSFYRTRVDQHLQIGLLAMALLRDIGPERLHSRKLRSFNEVAFQ
ncbi:MAG: AMP nucleosidase [Rhodospirillales bacterium]|nr:AMP nucleosidase [Rhodospirillales bacterium]